MALKLHIDASTIYSSKEIVSPTRILEKISEDTIQIIYFDNVEITAETAANDHILYDQFTNGSAFKRLIIAGNFTKITDEAQKFIASKTKRKKEQVIAEAIVVNSIAQHLMASFYFSLVKKNYPIKIFANLETAKEWLSKGNF